MRLAEYDRMILGYHGTRRSTALRVVQGLEPLSPSTNSDDWLGRGVYFWEHGPRQALRWAEQLRKRRKWGEDVAVLGALLHLGNCFDLLDPPNVAILRGHYANYVAFETEAGRPLPVNVRRHKRLDCAVLEYTYTTLTQTEGVQVDSARGVYVPAGGGKRVWPESWIVEEAHVQVCVRNPAWCIRGVWLVDPSTLQDG